MTTDNFAPLTMTCFKAYDVRGKIGTQLNKTLCYRIGRALAQYLLAETDSTDATIVVGADIRPTSKIFKQALIEGITDAGVSVMDLGMTGTEEVYFATSHYKAIGGVEITASHNPIEYNGLKFVRQGSRPIGSDTGLFDIQKIAEQGNFIKANKGSVHHHFDKSAYITHLLGHITNQRPSSPMTVVVNCGNGSAAPVIDLLEPHLPITLVKIHHPPDGTFPNGIPNPMIPANQTATACAVVAHKADLGVAFDGDFDRCFLFDETGRFIDGTYIVGLLAKVFLTQKPSTIVYDPRCVLNTEHIIEKLGGDGVVSPSGHSYIKTAMRQANAVYGGEMSAHHYFKDFFFCDSGMIPWLLIVGLLITTNKPLSYHIGTMMDDFPISGELNFKLQRPACQLLKRLRDDAQTFDTNVPKLDTTDGLSVRFKNWRFNIRTSNTEPLVRLNVESTDKPTLTYKTQLLCAYITDQGGTLV